MPQATGDSVLHVVPALFAVDDGIIGGAERYVFELARHMADRVPTSLVTFGRHDREERTGDLRIRVIGEPWHVRGQRSNPLSFRLLGEIRRSTVVHCHQQHIVVSSLAAASGRLLGRRVFCTELGGGGWDVSAYVSTDRWFDAHLHISNYSRIVAGHEGKPWAHVIRGGVDTVKFAPAAVRDASAGVLFVGRLLPHKGVDVLVRALRADMHATIVGPACDARYLHDLHALAEGKSVTFRHDCGDEELVALYRNATCVVLPSVYDDMYGGHTDVPELLGQTLLEGMACGLPAVTTAVASLPEVVEHEVTGVVVPPNDPAALGEALTGLVTDAARARRMGLAARERVESLFTWPAVVARCLEHYGLEPALGRRRDIKAAPAHAS
jgi:glycosyltransferase involved in cell wall biosynthesis